MNTLLKELQNNRRLRLGLWLIIGILAAYGLMLLDEQRQALSKDFQTRLERLAHLQSLVNQKQWSARMQGISQLKVLFEEKFWRANSKGLAEADVKSWLDLKTQHARLTNARVNVENAVDLAKLPQLWMINAEIQADFTPQAIQELLFYLYFDKWVVLERVNASNRGTKPRFTVQVRVYFQKPQNL